MAKNKKHERMVQDAKDAVDRLISEKSINRDSLIEYLDDLESYVEIHRMAFIEERDAEEDLE